MKIIRFLLCCFLVALIPRTTGTFENGITGKITVNGYTIKKIPSVDPKGNTIIRQCGKQLSKTIAKICHLKILNFFELVKLAKRLKRKLSLVLNTFYLLFVVLLNFSFLFILYNVYYLKNY